MDSNKKFQIVLGAILIALIVYMSYMTYGLFKGNIKSQDPKNPVTSSIPGKTTPTTTTPASTSN